MMKENKMKSKNPYQNTVQMMEVNDLTFRFKWLEQCKQNNLNPYAENMRAAVDAKGKPKAVFQFQEVDNFDFLDKK